MRLADIAAQAGVSEATVSRVLNGRQGVAPATRQAVIDALDVLGYDRPARLRPPRNGLIGLIVAELDNPIFPAFAQVIENTLAVHGYTAVLGALAPGGINEDDYTDLLLERGVSGIVFVSGLHADSQADHGRYKRLTDRGLPIVLINGYAEGVDATFVSSDEVGAMELAVAHLAHLGHRRIGLAVGQERFVPVIRKTEGYRRGMAEHLGVAETDEWIVNTIFTVEGGEAAAKRLLDRGCTAICCGSDLMAIGAIRAARQRGLRVPEDVSVIGFDDSPLMAYVDPPLTTVRQPVREMALVAVRSLLDEIQGVGAPHTELVFRPELVVRSSTGPLGSADQ
ncbi:LacI family transcriptional regulator [Actinoallomurus spadix]|nr:LacI family DNA-binding transcriptional regulator [Actinoallomurus spadix]MCO5991162.1 LacI family transcriptional regulator [Actinoallomurus spadix]